MDELQHSIDLIAPYLDSYGYGAVFGILLLESFGLPLPGETMLIAGALLAARGGMHLVPLLAAAWAAAVLGNSIGYAIGRFGGRRLISRYGGRIGITQGRLDRVEGFFERYGGGVVIVARFLVLLRQLNGIVAGSAGMGWGRFLIFNAVGATLWVGVWGIGGYLFGQKIGALAAWVQRFGWVALIAGLLALAAIAWVAHRKMRPQERAPTE